jgi:hypothetical protein
LRPVPGVPPRAAPVAAPLGQHARDVVSSIYAPRTGGAYDSYHRTAGIAGRTWRRGGGMAVRGARAATRAHAPHRCAHEPRCRRRGRTGASRGVPAGVAGSGLGGRPQRADRPPLGRERYRALSHASGGNGGLLTFGQLDHGGRGDSRACPEMAGCRQTSQGRAIACEFGLSGDLHGLHTCARSRSGSRCSACNCCPWRCAQTVAVPLAELEQNQDKLLPNLQARHIWLRVARLGVGACVVLH